MAPPRKADAPDLEKKPQGNEPRLDEADLPQVKSGADAMSNLAALQQSAGNLAVSGLVQRQPVRQAKAGGRRSNQVSFGPRAEILNFAVLFELATTRDALSTGRFDNASFAFTSPRLARTAELLAFVVGAIANEQRGGQIHQAAEIWRSIGSDVRAILTQAGHHGAPLDDSWAGFARLQEALHSEQAEELVRAGEASADLATPDAGLYVEQDRELGRIYQALVKVADESKGILQWNDRHIYRMTGVGGVGATEAQVRLMNYGRTALGAWVLWRDFQTLDERVAEARRRGWIHEYGTYAEFISRATTIAVDTTNAIVGLLRTSTTALRDAAVKASMQAAFNSGVAGSRFGDLAAAQVRYEARLAKFEGLRWAGGLSGGFQIVSGVWNLVIAIREDDVRGGVAAGHSIAQGGITLGGAITGAGAGVTTMVSGSVTVVWVTIEAIFDIAELSAWGRRQQKLAEIATILQGAARLIPAGKRMGAIADAFSRIDAADSTEQLAMEQRLAAMGAAPFAVVLRGLLAIRADVARQEKWAAEAKKWADVDEVKWADVMGPDARQALDALARYEFWPTDAVSPDVIMDLSAIAKPIFVGLRRVGDWAIAKYAESNQTAAGRARARALETGETGPDSP